MDRDLNDLNCTLGSKGGGTQAFLLACSDVEQEGKNGASLV